MSKNCFVIPMAALADTMKTMKQYELEIYLLTRSTLKDFERPGLSTRLMY